MSTYAEAYLSAGVDTGALKVGTQAAASSSSLYATYTEGGQYCKFGASTINVGGVGAQCGNAPNAAPTSDFMGQYIATACPGLGGTLCIGAPVLFSYAHDFGGGINFRSGFTTDATFGFSFLKFNSTVAWRLVANPAGTAGGSGSFHISSQGFGQTRLIMFGKDTNSGNTFLNAEGAGGKVIIGRNFAGSNAGTGGFEVDSGGASPATVATIDGAGLGTFIGGYIGPFFKSNTANPASAGTIRLAKTDALNFRNNANSGDVSLALNGSDQFVLPTVASVTSAGNVTAPAFVSNSANPASAGPVRLAQTDAMKFRNSANTADLTALSEATDVLQVGEATNGINVPGPANFANVTATGTITGGSIATGGDSFAGTPRIAWGSFLPGALSSTWTGAQFTPKKGINVVQIDLRAKAGPAGCTTFPVVQVTDGTTPINVTLNAAGISQSVAGGQNYAANSTIQVKVTTAGAGCTTAASDVNVTVQYKMQ